MLKSVKFKMKYLLNETFIKSPKLNVIMKKYCSVEWKRYEQN